MKKADADKRRRTPRNADKMGHGEAKRGVGDSTLPKSQTYQDRALDLREMLFLEPAQPSDQS
jgi:hypothetical protein